MELIDEARARVNDTASTAAELAQQSADAVMKAFDTHGSGIAHAVPKPRGKTKTLLPIGVVVVVALLALMAWRARRSDTDDKGARK